MEWIISPAAPLVPVVACVPHGGTEYPAELCANLAVRPEVLWSDVFTGELYDFLPGLGVTMITTPFSRFVADVNRDPGGQRLGPLRTSVVADRLGDGERIYRVPPSPAELQHRIDLVHRPFHEALDAVIEGHLRRFPRILLLDLHSFGVVVPGDILLGDRRGASARPEVTATLREAFTGTGFTVMVNERFTGGWTVQRFAANPRVDAVLIELNKRCYLQYARHASYDDPPPRLDTFDAVKARLRTALTAALAASQEAAGQEAAGQEAAGQEAAGQELAHRRERPGPAGQHAGDQGPHRGT
jgi:N-formylglutamate amidohydrolase